MKQKYFFILLFISIINGAQSETLTQAQMLEDISFLQDHIHQYFFPLPLLEQRTGINVDNEFKKLREEITDTTNTKEFSQIVRQGLNILNDGHSQIIPKQKIKSYLNSQNFLVPIGNISLADTLNAGYYYSLISDSVYPKIKTGIRAKYINGEYYNARPFTYNGTSIKLGEKISAINGIPINSFIQNNYSQMYNLLWDPIGKRWYSSLFTIALPLLGMQQYALTIGDKEVKLDCGKTVENIQKEYSQHDVPKVMLIDNNILYIRMPSMDSEDEEWYIKEFFQSYKPTVEKIIIDIRGNGGGNDELWINLLRKIIDKPLKYNYCVGINHNEALENALSSAFKELKIKPEEKKTEIYTETTEMPDSNSVHFKGKFYILQNEYTYSAAAALSSIALQNENMILIGTRSTFISGYTLPAIIFKLPNSGIAFTLAFSADLTGGKENPYMDKVEVEITEDINEYLDKVFNYNYYDKEYLLSKDKLIKYVREN